MNLVFILQLFKQFHVLHTLPIFSPPPHTETCFSVLDQSHKTLQSSQPRRCPERALSLTTRATLQNSDHAAGGSAQEVSASSPFACSHLLSQVQCQISCLGDSPTSREGEQHSKGNFKSSLKSVSFESS